MSDLGLWQWLADNSQVISILLSLLMLVVWATYLQLILVQYRATRRSSILITRAAGKGIRSRCLITNMSSLPIYVTSLIGKLHIGEREIELPLTDLQEQPEDLGSDPRSSMAQGSLNTGEYMNIGHFDDIIRRMLDANDEGHVQVTDVDRIELTVVAFHGWRDLPVGAVRNFKIELSSGGVPKILPLSLATEQINQRHLRRQLSKTLEAHL
ncbi:hypothetical protein [Aurantiacibacter suaedae]|uniref:hypothetical protein n=1 Tax=Aurantiacibacter suaedae TaxID=2545755 RepID=UPI0019D4F24E|nr:hypothetical protein [Aurantiacibacter suaedae]